MFDIDQFIREHEKSITDLSSLMASARSFGGQLGSLKARRRLASEKAAIGNMTHALVEDIIKAGASRGIEAESIFTQLVSPTGKTQGMECVTDNGQKNGSREPWIDRHSSCGGQPFIDDGGDGQPYGR